jgi:regulator of sigma E protease
MATTIIFLLVLTALVFVHELGHFLAARLFKIRVDEFAIGFPPRIFSWMWGKTRYAINILPLGGYVKIYGEGPDDERTPDSILSKNRFQQAVVLVAGVTFNVIFAWILLSFSLFLGTKASYDAMPKAIVSNPQLTVVMVAPGSPAEKAGLKSGDEILSITNAETLLASSSLSVEAAQKVIAAADNKVTFTVKQFTTSTTTKKSEYVVKQLVATPVAGLVAGKKAVGISMDMVADVKAGFFQSFYYGARQTYHLTYNVATGLYGFLKNVVTGNASLGQVSGPVGIAGAVGESAKIGFASLLVMAAVISANLAVINMVPFPALDGGRLLVVIIESIIRRELNPKIIQWVNAIGFLLLITLMIVVTVKDVSTLFH